MYVFNNICWRGYVQDVPSGKGAGSPIGKDIACWKGTTLPDVHPRKGGWSPWEGQGMLAGNGRGGVAFAPGNNKHVCLYIIISIFRIYD